MNDFVLIGSWATVFYKQQFKEWARLNKFVLTTRDMDFLVPFPRKIKYKARIPDLLDDLGFVATFHGSKGYIKLSHPELIIEFLTPERGIGADGPVSLPSLGMNATALRFLNFLSEGVMKVPVEDFHVILPDPARFAFHKIIIAQRRKSKDKANKDNLLALEILRDLLESSEKRSLRLAYRNLNTQWQKRVMAGLEGLEQDEIIAFLKQ